MSGRQDRSSYDEHGVVVSGIALTRYDEMQAARGTETSRCDGKNEVGKCPNWYGIAGYVVLGLVFHCEDGWSRR